MNFKRLGFCLHLLVVGLGFAVTLQHLHAGTTFVTSVDRGGGTLFWNISSNGTISPIDQSASATYGSPEGTAVDASGNLFVAYSGDAVLKYTTNGATLFASGLGAPNLLCFDNAGNLYGNLNNSIIKIGTNGSSSVYADGITGLNGFCFDTNGNLFASSPGQLVRITPGGTTNVFATAAGIASNYNGGTIFSLAIDGQGNHYAAMQIHDQFFNYAAIRLDANGAPIFTLVPIGGQYGTGQNIAADEVTNIIYSTAWHEYLGVNGPFGNILQMGPFEPNNTYVSYTAINETLAVYGPTIILQPKSQTVAAGSSVNLFSGAVGSGLISYQWYFNLTNLIQGATNKTLTLTNVSSSNIGQYSLVASNYLNFASSRPADLNVLPSLAINMVPAIQLYGGVGITYDLQYITMIGPTNAPWTSLATITLTNSPQFYSDYSAIGQPARLYRSVQLP